jgi:hypothetical protein
MASEKDPSIYNDRSTIGSSDELDEYGVWVKSEPQDLSSVSVETLPDIEDLPDFNADSGLDSDFNIESVSGGDTPEEDSFEFESIPEEEPLEAVDAVSDAYDTSEFTEVSLNDFLTDGEDLEEPVLEESVQDSDSDLIPDLDFDQAESLEEAIEEEPASGFDDVEVVSPEPQEPPRSSPDLSTQLLMKIADELASIKQELSSLKTEFSAIRREGAAEGKEGGFFDEEDDEKIALTGDELNNILNTADFTEEAGADATEAISSGFGSIETVEEVSPSEEPAESLNLSDRPDIIGEDSEAGDLDAGEISFDESDVDEIGGEYGGDQVSSSILDPQEFDITLDSSGIGDDLALTSETFTEEAAPEETGTSVQEETLSGQDEEAEQEEIIIDLSDDFTDTLDLDSKDAEELKILREEGAQPLTEAPEDISYLEEDPLGEEQDEPIDLSGAVIDEPDLSAGITENPIEEPSLDDISLDLDMEDEGLTDAGFSVVEDGDEVSLEEDKELEVSIPEEESILDIAPEEESFDRIVPEGFALEADEIQAPPDLAGEDLAAEEEPELPAAPAEDKAEDSSLPVNLKQELKTVLTYMDQLLESLPEDKIEEFAKSEYFDTYKKLFEELGLV